MKGKELQLYKDSLQLSVLQREVLIGTLLGDATIPKQSGIRTHNVKFEQKIGNAEYVNHLYEIFSDYYNLFYLDGVKIVPMGIGSMLTPRVLAYWFMDDGSQSTNRAYILHTYAFSWEDQERLKFILEDKFGLKISLHLDEKHKRIYIWAESVDKFNKLIIPYIHPCFSYKIHA